MMGLILVLLQDDFYIIPKDSQNHPGVEWKAFIMLEYNYIK